MRIHNAFTDDDGVKWEFLYEEATEYEKDEADNPIRDDDGNLIRHTTVKNFRYRREDEGEYLTLPSWADVKENWKITLCLFDEDEETEDLTFWEVT